MRRILEIGAIFTMLVFMFGCGDGNGSSDSGKKQGELYGSCYPNKTCNEGLTCDEENDVCLPDGNDSDADNDIDISDTDTSDEDSDNPQEPDETEKPDDNPEEPDNTEKPDEKPDENPEEPEDNDTPETPDETPVNPEATENHKISGAVQAGSATAVALYECGGTEKIAEANTDAKGTFSFKADITAAKTYCVKAGDFASCFKGMSDHVANISEITTAAYLLDKTCADIRKSETKIRTYAKLGTGEWLGELDYSKLSGINDGLKLLSSFTGSNDAKTLSEKIAEDAKKDAPEFAKLFNGFKVSANKTEIVLGETADSNVNFSVEGGSTKVAPNFKISWTLKNKTAEAATYKFTTSIPGEYVARAKLVSGSAALSQDSATVLFLQKKNGGTVYVSDTSKNISFRIDDGIYGVIPKGTVVKKNGNKINSISYEVLSSGGSQVSRLKFRPEGATFEGDSMYFVHELGTVYGGDPQVLSATRTNADGSVDVMNSAAGDPIMMAAAGDPIMMTAAGDPIMQAAAGDPIMNSAAGDPIMTAAAGDPIMTSAAGDPIMTSAAGDPIMSAAAGDPIMTSAAGDPIMTAAAGDPIMMGTSSSAMISQTSHYSTFTVEAANLPVSVENLVARWCDGSYYRGYDPIKFIKKGVEDYKPAGADKTDLLSYLTCEKFADLGSDLYELINKPVGFQRNLNLIENLFFVSEFYNRMKARQENGTFVAVKNGLELRSAIAALYTATTSYNRSTTFADLADSSLIPLTYSGNAPKDYTALAGNAGIYAANKKEMMIFANYITTSSKGPDFSNVTSLLTPDQLVCAWFNPDTEAQNCNKVYTLNEAGHVALGGTEVSVAEANAIFTKFFMPMNSRLSESEKLDLFRTFYLALKYAGTIFYNGSDISELHDALLETAYLVFNGINGNMNAVTITDTFDASAHTVSVLNGAEMATVPYITKLSALTDQISLKVAANSADVEKLLISIEGKEFEKVQENTRTYYKPKGNLKEKSIVLTPGTLSQGEKALKTLLGSENVDELGNITGKMTIVANSKISGKTYTTQKTYDFFVNSGSDGVNSKEVPANIQIFVNDSTGHAIPANANPTIILNPGNKVYYSETGMVSLENLTPAAYTIDAFADGYYAKNVSVNVPAGATFSVEIRLDEELTSTADANLELNISINTVKHPSKVYVQIYNDNMDLVANETARFNDGTNKYETLNIEINSGRYTLLAVGEDMYKYLEAITLYAGNNEKTITVVAKNACGNGIVDSAEECEPSVEGSTLEVLCGEIYPASTYPEKTATCDPATCTFNKSECGKAALCGDGIIDRPSEACDGGSKACAEIAGIGASTGSAPCADDCSGYITANNCSKTTESCGNLPANALWNDGTGAFTQTHNGEKWLPATKAATFGNTKEECVFSCAKGYKWNGSECIEAPLSLALICTGESGCFDNTGETEECPAYGEAFFGQDAQYAAAKYCMPHTFTTSGSGNKKIITDSFTHYEWQAASSSAMTFSQAETACSNYQQENGGSTAVWRLPSPAELLTIIDSGTASPALSDKFTANGHTFWAKEDLRNSGNAWRVDENGALTSVDQNETNSVICVRIRDYDAIENRFTATNETVKDNESGLMWQKQAVASRTWAEALSYCEEVSTADKFDWRLPNRNELASLINYEKANGVVSDFPGIAAKGFWTSTSTVSGNEAWTVDFETGKIESSSKTNTKYIICVRNDEPCFGDECAEPCSFNACKGMANSTGLCTANDYSFTCGCKSGFNWNHGKCLLATTRYVACVGLPENAIWNSVFGISQSYDGENWYPSETGSFNKIASTTECRFVCATNYKWDADEEKCLPVSRMTNCSEKKPYSDWNVVSKISQTWDGEKWVPSSESEYNAEPSEEECRFICKEHYNWDSENNICDGETQPATCIGLPANAHWWNEDATITQTWTSGGWAPTSAGSYHDTAENNKCYFGCNENYSWKNNACVADGKFNVACNDLTLPDNAEWNQYNQINQTWSGTEWLPTTAGSYNETPDPAYCRFKCKAHYNWNGSTCSAVTNIVTCTGKPTNAEWNTASSIIQYWDGEKFSPTDVASYGETPTTEECRFKCNENYTVSDDRNSCVPAKRTKPCEGLPANAAWRTSASGTSSSFSITQEWSGSEWTPSLSGAHGSYIAGQCRFTCIDEGNKFKWEGGTCVPNTKTDQPCEGLPENAEWTGGFTSISRTWNSAINDFEPSNIGTFNPEADSAYCRFKCKENYTWDGEENAEGNEGECVADTRVADCNPRPENSVWNYAPAITQTWDGKQWLPELDPKYSAAGSENECRYVCDNGYYPLDGQCVDHPCEHNPCDGVNNSLSGADVCEEKIDPSLSYSCKCDTENGFYWWGKTGCRDGNGVALGNICTNTMTCHNNDAETGCPESKSGSGENYNFYGQDAYYAEAGFCAPKNFSIVGDTEPVLIDNTTGLHWRRTSIYYSWSSAKSYCEGLNTSGYGGETGWRLPSVKEFMTIMDNYPTLDPEYFSNASDNSYYWTITADKANSNNVWVMYTRYGGYIGRDSSASGTGKTFCVNGSFNDTPAFSNGAYAVKDAVTGLYWQKGYTSNKTWQQALEYCENLVSGGFSDWRLPNINELSSIVDYTKTNPAVNTSYLNMPSSGTEYKFWSSTTKKSIITSAFEIDFKTGARIRTVNTEDGAKTNKNYVRCVRSDICGDGKFLLGKNCVDSPCALNSCSSVTNSTGVCTPLTESRYSCGCVDGYTWESSTSSCIPDPCITDNECTSMEGSDGVCTPDDGKIKCGCKEGYFWNGSRCMKKVFGNICTGQTRCFDETDLIECPLTEDEDFFGQDANYAAKGTCVPQNFIIRTPYSAHTDEKVVRDENTKLEWQRTISDGTYTFNQAISYCADLEYAGYDDWRVPTTKELISIADYDKFNPTADTTYFQDAAGQFWTSKRGANNTNYAWTVYFFEGTVINSMASTPHSVRCVRGETQPENSFATFKKNGDDIVKDNVTGLMWGDMSLYITWQEALEYCEESTFGGYTDWRLPNHNELMSIINYDKFNLATDIPPMQYANFFWSSTTTPSGSNNYSYAFSPYFGSGVYEDTKKNNTRIVLCVR